MSHFFFGADWGGIAGGRGLAAEIPKAGVRQICYLLAGRIDSGSSRPGGSLDSVVLSDNGVWRVQQSGRGIRCKELLAAAIWS